MRGVPSPLSTNRRTRKTLKNCAKGLRFSRRIISEALPALLQTIALTAVGVPVYEHVNAQFGELNHINFASKLYLLLYDTDIDFMIFTGLSRTTRYGFDFSKNRLPLLRSTENGRSSTTKR